MAADADWKRANTDWFRDARWGVFFHYLSELHLPQEAHESEEGIGLWNDRVDQFDVGGLVRQLKESGAGYFFLSIGQNSGYFCAPNATYDRLVGRQPSRLSRRDLVSDLADALGLAGIRMMVYLPSMAPCRDARAVRSLRCTPPWELGFPPECTFSDDARTTDERLTEFQQHWEAIIREWSLRWGRRVHGWWIDGCYFGDRMYNASDAPNFRSFAEAMKAGNPDSLVAFNAGVKNPIVSVTESEDYAAGEVSNTLPTNGEEPCVIPVGRWVNSAQYHLLSFLGGVWGRGTPRFTDAMVVAYTRYVNSWEGVVTWDVPHTARGLIAEPFMKQLRGLKM